MSDSQTAATHMRATIVLGLPLVGAQLAQMLINVTDTIMLGWLGTKELAAGTLAFQAFFILLIFGLGFGAAMMPLMASALGRGDERGVRRSARMGLWGLVGLALLFQIPLIFTRDILIALGQKAELADLAQSYMRWAQWSMIPAFIVIGLRAILTSFERAQAVLLTTIAAAILNAILNYAFIFGNLGAPRLGMAGAGVATVLANALAVIIVLTYMLRLRDIRSYKFFARLWRPDWDALRAVCAMGITIGLTIFAEAGLFTAASVMIGWIGTIPLAAHGIALQIASISFMFPLGLAQAGTVRISRAQGRGSKADITRAAGAVFVLALIICIAAAIVFFAIPERLISVFIDRDNPDIAQIILVAVPLIWMAAAFQLVDGIQAIAGGCLRGLQDTRVPMYIATASYWGVGMSVAYVLAFKFDLGAVGVWGGLASGLAVAAVFLTARFIRRESNGVMAALEPKALT